MSSKEHRVQAVIKMIRLKGLLLITLALAVLGCCWILYRMQATVHSRNGPIQTVENHAHPTNTMDSSNCKRSNFISTEQEQRHGKGTDILISGYMRSGSSLLGHVLRGGKDTFYMFEPLWKTHVWEYYSGTKLCHYIRPECHEDAGSASLNESLSSLADAFRCNLQGIFHERLYLEGGQSWEVYQNCIKTGGENATMNCYLLETDMCLKAQHRVMKLLRMDLDIAASLLCQTPRLKIVHLFRDPRAVLNSHIHTEWFPVRLNMTQEIEMDVKVICSRIEHDIKAYKTLVKQYPTRVIAVQYEDFDDFSLKLKVLLRFLDKEFSENDRTLAMSVSGSPFGYRDTLPWSVVRIVDTYCENVYRELGLVKFNNELEFRDKTISPILRKLPFALVLNNIINV